MNETDRITQVEQLNKALRLANEERMEQELALEEVRRENAGLQRQVGMLLEQQERFNTRIEQLQGELNEARSCLSEDATQSYTVEVCYRDVEAVDVTHALLQIEDELREDEGAVITAVFDADGVQVWTEGE